MRRRYPMTKEAEELKIGNGHPPRRNKQPSSSNTSRNSNTPSRIQGRLSPGHYLSRATSSLMKKRNSLERRSKGKYFDRSSHKEEWSNRSLSKNIYYEGESCEKKVKAHPETFDFVRKNFGDACSDVSHKKFVQKIMKEYESLWGTQNIGQIFDDFAEKISEIFGKESVNLR